MSRYISIRTDESNKIIQRYIGSKVGDGWYITTESDWPEDESGDDEIPRYYYNSEIDEITVEYETV